MHNSTVDVLIIGAGPVGLTAAAAFTHHGLACRIIDKSTAANNKSKALAVWSRSLELLDGLGLAETFVQSGLKLSGGSVYADGRRLVHLKLTGTDSPFGFPLMIPQNLTEKLLTEHLLQKGVMIERGVELTMFSERADAVACILRHADGREEALDVPWLIGCDGAHSTVRHTLGMDFTGHTEPNDWMLADVSIDGSLANDEVSVFWHEKGVLAFFPIDRNRFRVIADYGLATDGAARPDLTLADAQAKVDERGPGGLTLSSPVWLANFRINERKVADYRRGRVFLAGDASHIHSPAVGQGMNTGMQDAFNLAWKLALVQQGRGQAEPLLQSYSSERSAVGDQVLRNAERFTTVATLDNPIAQSLRNHIAPILGSFQFVQDKIRDEWFELSINYRHSALSSEDWPRLTGGIAAGDRLCNAPLTAADGQPITLFAALRGNRHALLLLPGTDGESLSRLLAIADEAARAFPDIFSTHVILKTAGPDVAVAGAAVWFDAEGRVYGQLHAEKPTLVLVRPDGYIGYRCQPADGAALHRYLGRFLVSQ